MNRLDRIWEDRRKHWLLPLSFLFGSLLNFGFYYIGLAYKENPLREYGFIIGQLAFAVLCGLAFLSTLRNNRLSKGTWACLLCIALVYGGALATGVMRFGLNGVLRNYIVRFVCYALPAGLAGVCAGLSRSDRKFLPLMEKISFFVLPGGLIIFFNALAQTNPFFRGRALGIIGYMPVAYTLMPFLLVHSICLSDKLELILPVTNRPAKHPQLLRSVLIAVYWIAILTTGTRGTYVCVIGFCVLLVLMKLLYRDRVLRAVLLSCALAAVMLFSIFVYAPPGMKAVGRMQIFLDGLTEGKLVTSAIEEGTDNDSLSTLVEKEGGQSAVNNKPDGTAETDKETGKASDKETDKESGKESDKETDKEAVPETEEEPVIVSSRGTLFKLAFMEFLKAPLTGMGCGGYEVKYVHFPHNAPLQVLAEVGLLGGIPFFAMLFYAIIRMFRAGKTDRSVRYLLLFFLTYAIRSNISNCMWYCDYLLCALCFGVTFPISASGSGEPEDAPTAEQKTPALAE